MPSPSPAPRAQRNGGRPNHAGLSCNCPELQGPALTRAGALLLPRDQAGQGLAKRDCARFKKSPARGRGLGNQGFDAIATLEPSRDRHKTIFFGRLLELAAGYALPRLHLAPRPKNKSTAAPKSQRPAQAPKKPPGRVHQAERPRRGGQTQKKGRRGYRRPKCRARRSRTPSRSMAEQGRAAISSC